VRNVLIDSLASRSRLALVRALADAPGSSATELAAAARLHLNTVRTHLKDLGEAGVLEQEAERGGRPGRPSIRYRLRDDVAPRGDELLGIAALLGETLTSVAPKAAELRQAAIEWGRRRSRQASGAAPERELQEALERLGFAVTRDGKRLRLSSCPCPLVAHDDPAMICGLADAVADGVLEGTELRVAGREHDPARRWCAITLAAA
jgi:predicted ArsR family transcriptional regulator